MMLRTVGLAATLAVALTGCRGDSTTNVDAGPGDGDGGGDDGITIYDIQTPDGEYSLPGTVVPLIEGVVITAIDRFGNRTGGIYVQEPQGGAFSGVLVFNPTVGGGLTVDDLQPGDIVDIAGGVVDEFALDTDVSGRTLTELGPPDGGTITVTKVGEGAVPTPEVVDPVVLGADDVEAEKWEGVLIEIQNVAVNFAADGVSSTDPTLAEATVTGPFRVSSSLAPLLDGDGAPLHARDTCFASIIGVGDYFFNYKILPTSPQDLVTGATSSCLYEDDVTECHDGTDDDHDGFMDCADFSCQAADPTCTSDTTIQDVQMGIVPPGTAVRLTDVIVTARGEKLLWVQEAGGGEYSGVAIFNNGGIPTDFNPGDVVTVEGSVSEFMGTGDPDSITEITGATITETGTAAVPDPALVPIGDLGDPGTAEPWEGVLISIGSVSIETAATVATFGEWRVTDGTDDVMIDDVMFTPYMFDSGSGELVGPGPGTCYTTIAGVFHYSFAAYKIEPRTAADLGPECP